MILYPAIDLKDGQCVRLLRGEMDAATVFNDDPAAQARAFQAAGCEWIHLVDLNGAFKGEPVNGAAVEAILNAISVPAQLGGGIRDMATIDGIDARKGMVAVEGWAETTGITALDLAKKFEDAGVAAIIYTDIDRDGAMQGPNVEATAALAKAVSIPVIASGGVSSMDDLTALKACGAALDGVISGRALYDGRIDVAAAVALLGSA
jgi:phosphoribosylformimino-5-aminoimidazole carboxamide ribotide isomerase